MALDVSQPTRRDVSAIDVTVILVSYNTSSLLAACLTRLEDACKSLRTQVIIVDNASRDDSLMVLRRDWSHFEIVANRDNVGFGRANNQVLSSIRGRHALLLNIDAFVNEDGLRKTVEFMDSHRECGVLGVRLVGSNGDLQPSCRYFPTPWNIFLQRTGLSRLSPQTRLIDDLTWTHDTARVCDWVPGCFYLVRAEVLQTVGLFDPRFFVYYEEVDHCRRVKAAGWDVVYFPYTTVVHLGGEAAKSEGELGVGRQLAPLQIESELLYLRKHHGLFGVVAQIALLALGDCIAVVKAVIKPNGRRRPADVAHDAWTRLSTYVDTFRNTAWALRPTR